MIMGKNGQRLKDLEKETETRITIPGHNDKSDQILVVGAAENIELACAEILKISEEQVILLVLFFSSFFFLFFFFFKSKN